MRFELAVARIPTRNNALCSSERGHPNIWNSLRGSQTETFSEDNVWLFILGKVRHAKHTLKGPGIASRNFNALIRWRYRPNNLYLGKGCHRIQTKRKLVSKDFNQKAKALLEFSLKPWQRGIWIAIGWQKILWKKKKKGIFPLWKTPKSPFLLDIARWMHSPQATV